MQRPNFLISVVPSILHPEFYIANQQAIGFKHTLFECKTAFVKYINDEEAEVNIQEKVQPRISQPQWLFPASHCTLEGHPKCGDMKKR
jgi:hypothetical protein